MSDTINNHNTPAAVNNTIVEKTQFALATGPSIALNDKPQKAEGVVLLERATSKKKPKPATDNVVPVAQTAEVNRDEQPKHTQESEDPVFAKYGPPFLVNDAAKVVLNERSVAIKCATQHQVRYDTKTKHFERFDGVRGLWVSAHEVEVYRLLDDLLVDLGQVYKQELFVRRITPSKLASVAKMMRPHDLKVEAESIEGLIHTRHGLVNVADKTLELRKFEVKYSFRHSSEITFDLKAKCPKFIGTLLKPALPQEDIDLLQQYCGSMLTGPNTSHGIMVIRGTPGGGKSTLVSIIEKVLGEHKVAHLRTAHLGGRFETSAFLGKRLLVGKDVPGDTLALSGARMLKSLVGGDLMQAEIKFNPDKQPVRGDYHVIIVANNKLRIALDGDAGAWQRRLLVVDFNNPKTTQPIVNLADKLFEEESSGILNWMIEGARAYQSEMQIHGHLRLSKEHQNRVETLINDSDNLPVFVNRCLAQKAGADVTSEELLLGYHRVCKKENWTPVNQHQFQKRIPEIMAQRFNVARRNDIERDGKAVRGFKNVKMD